MTIALADVFHYWDWQRGSLVPTIGGLPTYARAGNAMCLQSNGRYYEVLTDKPRFESSGLLIEKAQTNQVLDPFDPDSGDANWLAESGITRYEAVSLFDGEAASKYLNIDTSSTWESVYQSFSSQPAAERTTYWIMEQAFSDTIRLGIQNSVSNLWHVYADFTFSTESYANLTSDSGISTDLEAGVIKLGDVGPNGGKVLLFWLTDTPGAVNNMRMRAYAVQGTAPASVSSEGFIYHAAQLVEDSAVTSPVDGSRVTETLYWPPMQIDNQADKDTHRGYCIFFEVRLMKLNSQSNHMLLFIGETVGPRIQIQVRNTGDFRCRLIPQTGFSAVSTLTVSPDHGEILQFLIHYDNAETGSPGPNIKWMVRRADGTITSSLPGFGAGLGARLTTWEDGSYIHLNQEADASEKGSAWYRKLKIVAADAVDAAVDGTEDQELMDELAGFHVSANAERVSNVVAT